MIARALLPAALLLAGVVPATACELVFTEHRTGVGLATRALDPTRPRITIAFTHSVLGTPVADVYEWHAVDDVLRAVLIEERFQGDGYGLPHAPGPDETLVRDGDGWRLRLHRIVDPLVVLPLPEQRMRVLIDGQEPVLLGDLSRRSLQLQTRGCAPR